MGRCWTVRKKKCCLQKPLVWTIHPGTDIKNGSQQPGGWQTVRGDWARLECPEAFKNKETGKEKTDTVRPNAAVPSSRRPTKSLREKNVRKRLGKSCTTKIKGASSTLRYSMRRTNSGSGKETRNRRKKQLKGAGASPWKEVSRRCFCASAT